VQNDLGDAEAERMHARVVLADTEQVRKRKERDLVWAELEASVSERVAKYPPAPTPDPATLLPTM